jgi:imidazolonepropionase-like amidohydrolase
MSTRITPLLLLLVCAAPHAHAQAVSAIVGATVIDVAGGAPIRDAVIVIEGGRIRQLGPRATTPVPANATVTDARDKYVVPGLADMHHHLGSGSLRLQQNLRANLGRLLGVGITTVFNPSVATTEFSRLKAESADDAAPVARFFGTGPMVTVQGDTLGGGNGGLTPRDAAQAAAAVRELKAAGVDAIKVMRDDFSWFSTQRLPLMPIAVLAALVDEAHRQKLKVFVHAPRLAQAREALRAGVDGLLHGIVDEPIDAEFLGLLQKNRASYVPTLGLFEDVADVAAWTKRQAPYWDRLGLEPPAIYQSFLAPQGVQIFQTFVNNGGFVKERLGVARANVKRVADAGLPVVLGTDTGFFGVFFGVATQIELELLVEAGLTPLEALRSATLNAARMIDRESDFGSIAPGMRADLLILDANPLEDIRNIARIDRVMKGGIFFEVAGAVSPR